MSSKTTETALITGASSGIGTELARTLARQGADLILTARRRDRLETLAAEIRKDHGVRVDVVPMDLAEEGAAQRLHEAVQALGREVSIVVNNAGFGMYGSFVEHEPERIERMMRLNMTALTVLTRLFAKEMVARGRGRVLQVSSVGAFQPSPYYSVYAATKAYGLYFSEALAFELRDTGVTVTTVCPGLTATEFHEVADHIKPKSMEAVTQTAESVALVATRAMLRGKPVVTSGWANRMAAFFVKLMPRSWATAVSGLMMRPKTAAS